MGGRSSARADGRTHGRTDGRTDGPTDGRADDDVGGALVFYLQEVDWRKPIPEIAPTPPTNPANTAKTLVFTMSSFVLLDEARMCKFCILVRVPPS